MANEQRRARIDRHGDESVSRDAAEERLENLRGRFAQFRREHRMRARIPQTLRAAALEMIQSGIPERQVLRECRISREQLDWWRRSETASEQQLEQRARIFPVVDDSSEPSDDGAVQAETSDVHLRVGRWEISIRQIGS